ncbi:MAG: hypothetical protein IJK98_03840 [Clostridia bacterium]|nr:hypothetical protein [Clostridia bacterium]
MKKRFVLCAILISLCVFSACQKSEEPVTTEPTNAPPAATATEATATEAADPVSFRLEKLPDIGTYQPKKAEYFYGAPLREFRASDDYGALLPYSLGGNPAEYGSLGRYGFMTTDGKIVTGPIYESVYGEDFGGKTVYIATSKVLDESPVMNRNEEDEEGASAAYQKTVDYYDQHARCQLISADGSRYLSQPSEWRWFTDDDSGLTLFWTSAYEETETPGTYHCVSLRLYDTDLNLAAELGPQLRAFQHAEVCAIEKDRVVIRAVRYEEPDYTADTDLLFFRDGQLERTLALGGDFPYRVAGGLILCEKRLCDEYGNTVYSLGESHSDTAYDPDGECFYVFHTSQGKLVKLDREGRVTATAETQPSTSYLNVSLHESDGKTYAVIPHSRDYENTDGYVVYDADLREICTIGGEGTEKTNFCEEYGDGPGLFLVASDGKTEILDITGKVLASVPFVYEGYNLNYAGDRQLIYLYREHTRCAVYSTADHSVVSVPFHGETISYPDYFSRKLVAYTENIKTNGTLEENDWRYVIWDMTTGERLLENLSSFNAVTVNGKTYFNYLKNDVSYVCDEDLRVIAALYDGLFV